MKIGENNENEIFAGKMASVVAGYVILFVSLVVLSVSLTSHACLLRYITRRGMKWQK